MTVILAQMSPVILLQVAYLRMMIRMFAVMAASAPIMMCALPELARVIQSPAMTTIPARITPATRLQVVYLRMIIPMFVVMAASAPIMMCALPELARVVPSPAMTTMPARMIPAIQLQVVYLRMIIPMFAVMAASARTMMCALPELARVVPSPAMTTMPARMIPATRLQVAYLRMIIPMFVMMAASAPTMMCALPELARVIQSPAMTTIPARMIPATRLQVAYLRMTIPMFAVMAASARTMMYALPELVQEL